MLTVDLARLWRRRPVLREFDTGLPECHAAVVLPDEAIAVVGDQSNLYYFMGGDWTPDGRSLVVGTEHGRIFTWTYSPPET